MPERIQLRRIKGWRKPEGAVVVARPTKWGNPCRWQDYPPGHLNDDGEWVAHSVTTRREWAVIDFESVVRFDIGSFDYPDTLVIRRELRGKDLACWCPFDGARCHADVLLEVANA